MKTKAGLFLCLSFAVLFLVCCSQPKSRLPKHQQASTAEENKTPVQKAKPVYKEKKKRKLQPSVIKPNILSRQEWKAKQPVGKMKEHKPRYITIHHTATFQKKNVSLNKKMLNLQSFSQSQTHLSNGRLKTKWPDVPYHFYIDFNGKIAEGREIKFAGDTNTNYDPSGHILIVVEGNFEIEKPSQEQLKSLKHLITYLTKTYQIPPSKIKGHSEYASTVCPGKNLKEEINILCKELKENENQKNKDISKNDTIKTSPDEIHKKATVVDLHCDALYHFMKGKKSLSERSNLHQVDIPRLFEGGVDVQFFAIWPNPKEIPKGEYYQYVTQTISKFKEFVKKNSQKIEIAKSLSDIERIIKKGKIAGVLAIEGGHATQGDIKKLKKYSDLGVRYITITWNNSNEIGDAQLGKKIHNGLSHFGKKVIKEMENLGILVDVSHISEKSFWDIIKICKKPIIASHSNAKALCNRPRNLTDEQIKAIAKTDGVIGINFHSPYLRSDGKRATIEDVVRHIDYIKNLVGVNYIAIGTDYDGFITPPIGLGDVSKLKNLTYELFKRGYVKKDVEKILGKNVLRVLKKIEK